jgi:hypothetical protein
MQTAPERSVTQSPEHPCPCLRLVHRGFETPDLQDAQDLLDELASTAP